MARFTYRTCRCCGSLHEIGEWPVACMEHFGATPRDAPYVRPDGMDPIVSMADGRTYDSRSGYYKSVRQAGCEIVGDDRAGFGPRPEYRPQGVGESIKRALHQHGIGD